MPWSTMTPLPTSLMGLSAATFDAPAPGSGYRIYAIAGLTSDIASPSGFDTVATVVAYDPQAPNSGWKPVASISSERSFLAAASIPGALHVLGGILNSQEIVTTHEVYDAAANVWSQTTPLPTPRANHAAVIGHDGRIYVIGGQDANNDPLNTVDAFDPLSKVWSSAVHPMQTARESPAAVTAPNGKIYVICGWVPYESGVSEHPLDTVEIYDPGSNSWSFGPSLPNTPGGSGLYKLGAAVGPDGLIYVMGGFDFEQGSSSTLYSLDPSNPNAQWLTQPPMTSARGGLAAVTGPDGLIYAIGGGGFQGTLDVVEAYNIVANTSTKPDPYIGNGTYQSPDIILMNIMTNEVVPIGGKPGGAWDTLLIPNMNYTLQCVVYNDANVAAPNTKVRFWHFPGGVGTAGALISEETVTVPANGSIVVTSSNPFQSGALGAHECAVVSLANAQSQYFSNDPTTAAAVIDPTVPHPVGSGHFGSAWRNTNSVAMGGEIKIWNFPFVANLGGLTRPASISPRRRPKSPPTGTALTKSSSCAK
jgi:hypothetical protein